jgi:hypothetical protein
MSLEPLTIVELEQPRCGLRFGVGVCTATGTPKCYQTWGSCPVKSKYDPTGSIRWRFVQNRPGIFPFGDFTDVENPATNGIPVDGLSVSTGRGTLNVAGVLEGKGPFGIRSTVSVSMRDFAWGDSVGDFYLGERSNLPTRLFWACWVARNAFFGGMYLRVYDGYVGDDLAAMRQRLYVLDSIDGPDASGLVTLSAYDPIALAINAKSKFPEEMDVKLVDNIDAVQTTIRVVTNEPPKLTKAYGNDTVYHMRIGSEILSYTGVSLVAVGVYDLTGCVRARLDTAAAPGSIDGACQRVGRYVDTPTWEIGYDLMTAHTPLPASFVDHAQWATEGDTYLPTLRSTVTIAQPTLVDDLMGEVCQQGMFYVWWDEHQQTIPMLAVRPPRGAVVTLSGDANILAGSVEHKRDPASLITRVFLYYSPRSVLNYSKTPADYRIASGRIEAEPEHPNAAGAPRPFSIFARFVNTESHAVQVINRILSRYKEVPRFLSLRISGKDRLITVGDVSDVITREIIDVEGRFLSTRWQVIAWEALKSGEVYLLDLQTYDYVGLFAEWMADGAPDWVDATTEQRAMGAWWADDDGLMPDGSPGYQWQ